MSALFRAFGEPFMQRALIESLLLAVITSVCGAYVLVRKMAFVTDAMHHAIFPGVATAFVLGLPLFAGALVAGVLAAILVTIVTRWPNVDGDDSLALVIAGFFGLGVVIVSHRAGYAADLTALLFGRVLAVDVVEIVQTAVVGLVVVGVLVAAQKELVGRAFDVVHMASLGYRIVVLDLVLNLMVALTVVAAVRAVGTVLVIALVVIPVATARLLTDRLGRMVVLASALSCGAAWTGLAISWELSVHHGLRAAAGATVVVQLTLVFLVALVLRGLTRRRARQVVSGTVPGLSSVRA